MVKIQKAQLGDMAHAPMSVCVKEGQRQREIKWHLFRQWNIWRRGYRASIQIILLQMFLLQGEKNTYIYIYVFIHTFC